MTDTNFLMTRGNADGKRFAARLLAAAMFLQIIFVPIGANAQSLGAARQRDGTPGND